MMTKDALIAFLQKGVVKAPDGMLFRLKNGGTSEYMVDLTTVVHSSAFMKGFAAYFNSVVQTQNHNNLHVTGPSISADPLCAAIAMSKSYHWLRVRPTPKNRGIDPSSLVIFQPSDKMIPVLVVEDVITTGTTVKKLMDEIQQEHPDLFDVRAILTLVAREEAPYQINGVPITAICRLKDGLLK